MFKKVLLLTFITIISSNICFGEITSYNIENEVIKINQSDEDFLLLNKARKDRNTVTNVLNLTPTQICKVKNIEEQRLKEITPVVDDFIVKKEELKKLQTSGATKSEINTVKKEMNCLTKKIKKICKKYDNSFEKLLTPEQRSKYKVVQKLRFEDLRNVKKTQRYSSKKSDLRPFGENISQSAYLEEVRSERSLKNKCKKIFKRNLLRINEY